MRWAAALGLIQQFRLMTQFGEVQQSNLEKIKNINTIPKKNSHKPIQAPNTQNDNSKKLTAAGLTAIGAAVTKIAIKMRKRNQRTTDTFLRDKVKIQFELLEENGIEKNQKINIIITELKLSQEKNQTLNMKCREIQDIITIKINSDTEKKLFLTALKNSSLDNFTKRKAFTFANQLKFQNS